MPDDADLVFSDAENAIFERDLRVADGVLASVVAAYGGRLLLSAGRGWPGRSLTKRVGFRTFTLRIALNAEFLESRAVSYAVETVWMLDYGEILHRSLGYDLVQRLTQDQMADERLLHDVIERALEANLKRRR